jgi:RNA polymerase sigma-70 factor, ECF subfamily
MIANGPITDADETELVQRALQGGDQDAFAELMRRNATTSFRLALSVLKNRQEAEDEVQNSFFKAWQRLSTFQFESRFSTWLRSIVLNQSLMRFRAARRAPLCPLESSSDHSFDSSPEHAIDEPSPEQTVVRDELLTLLRAETQKLPPLLREVLILRDLEEKSVEDIAAQLGITEAAVKSRLARARPMLRERMERHSRQPRSLLAL